jgi:hypothetical protein
MQHNFLEQVMNSCYSLRLYGTVEQQVRHLIYPSKSCRPSSRLRESRKYDLLLFEPDHHLVAPIRFLVTLKLGTSGSQFRSDLVQLSEAFEDQGQNDLAEQFLTRAPAATGRARGNRSSGARNNADHGPR